MGNLNHYLRLCKILRRSYKLQKEYITPTLFISKASDTPVNELLSKTFIYVSTGERERGLKRALHFHY